MSETVSDSVSLPLHITCFYAVHSSIINLSRTHNIYGAHLSLLSQSELYTLCALVVQFHL